MFASFEEVLQQRRALVDQEVSMHAHVVVAGIDEAFAVADYDGFLRAERIEIRDHGEISRRLLAELPPYGGGACSYDEEMWLTGTLKRREDDVPYIEMKSCIVRRDDTEVVCERPSEGTG